MYIDSMNSETMLIAKCNFIHEAIIIMIKKIKSHFSKSIGWRIFAQI